MGDRTWLDMTFAQADRAKIVKQFGPPEDEKRSTGDTVIMNFTEVNYGGCGELQGLAEGKVDFIATHGHGGEYSSAEYISLDGELFSAPFNHDGDFYVTVNVAATGDVIPSIKDIEGLKTFFDARAALLKKWRESKTLVIENVNMEKLEQQRKDLNTLHDKVAALDPTAHPITRAELASLLDVIAMLDHWSDERWSQIALT